MDALHLLPKTTDSYAVHALENCNARFRHSKPCQLLTASHISSPFIAGILSPVIVIPDMHLDEKEWEGSSAVSVSDGNIGLTVFLESIGTASEQAAAKAIRIQCG